MSTSCRNTSCKTPTHLFLLHCWPFHWSRYDRDHVTSALFTVTNYHWKSPEIAENNEKLRVYLNTLYSLKVCIAATLLCEIFSTFFFTQTANCSVFLRHDVHAIHTAMGVHCRNAMQGVSNFFKSNACLASCNAALCNGTAADGADDIAKCFR